MKKSCNKSPKAKRHLRRRRHIRRALSGSVNCPRVSVRRSLKNLYAQIIDDDARCTLIGLGTLSQEIRASLPKGGGNIASAEMLGRQLAEKAKAAGIERVVFDRNGYRFHGRVKAFAEALRGNGLKF